MMVSCLVKEGGCHRRIDPAAQTEHHFLIADLLADARASLFDERTHCPIHRAAANVIDEILENLFSARRMRYLGMKLQSVQFSLRVFDRGKWRIFRARSGAETGGQRRYFIAMTAPDVDL